MNPWTGYAVGAVKTIEEQVKELAAGLELGGQKSLARILAVAKVSGWGGKGVQELHTEILALLDYQQKILTGMLAEPQKVAQSTLESFKASVMQKWEEILGRLDMLEAAQKKGGLGLTAPLGGFGGLGGLGLAPPLATSSLPPLGLPEPERTSPVVPVILSLVVGWLFGRYL